MRTLDKDGYALPPVYQETVPTTENKTGLWRFLTPIRREKISPCRKSCPLENNIPRWINEVKEGNWGKAWSVMKKYNPFPAITGHVCYRFCEDECSRGFLDEAVHIGEMEKKIGLWRHRNYKFSETKPGNAEANEGKKPEVAIAGSGPAGLSCAYYLNVLGAKVTILEKMSQAGGLLATGIPEYRLPRDILQKELDILQSEGIIIKTGLKVGKDITLNDLRKNYAAVLLAVGAQESKLPQIAGDAVSEVAGAVEFLRDIHLNKIKKVQGQIVVIGGGNAAVDAACMAKLQGADKVTLLYRRTREEMPAHSDEVNAAREAGVDFVFCAVLQEIIGGEKIQKIRACRAAPSRRGERLQILAETAFDLDCDFLIMAVGQESGLSRFSSLSFSADGIAENGAAVFAAGDALSGPATVADAIFSGRKAALLLAGILWPEKNISNLSVASSLNGNEPIVELEHLNPRLFLRQGRFNTAEDEAGRCFGCGICNNCGVCWAFCPDLAVGGSDFEILLDYCKGCGICVRECPTGVLEMEEVSSGGA